MIGIKFLENNKLYVIGNAEWAFGIPFPKNVIARPEFSKINRVQNTEGIITHGTIQKEWTGAKKPRGGPRFPAQHAGPGGGKWR